MGVDMQQAPQAGEALVVFVAKILVEDEDVIAAWAARNSPPARRAAWTVHPPLGVTGVSGSMVMVALRGPPPPPCATFSLPCCLKTECTAHSDIGMKRLVLDCRQRAMCRASRRCSHPGTDNPSSGLCHSEHGRHRGQHDRDCGRHQQLIVWIGSPASMVMHDRLSSSSRPPPSGRLGHHVPGPDHGGVAGGDLPLHLHQFSVNRQSASLKEVEEDVNIRRMSG